MARKKTGGANLGIIFSDFAALAETYEAMGEDVKKGVEEALIVTQETLNPTIRSQMQKHNSENIISHIIDDRKVKWQGNIASIGVGFKMEGAGFNSIYLMYDRKIYGTPRKTASSSGVIKGDSELYSAAKGKNRFRTKVRKAQREAFIKAIDRRMS